VRGRNHRDQECRRAEGGEGGREVALNSPVSVVDGAIRLRLAQPAVRLRIGVGCLLYSPHNSRAHCG
jgi:hypothetical protein